ncbi:hypothetical protein BGX20_005630, partial [Mortierella sp. AD010]
MKSSQEGGIRYELSQNSSRERYFTHNDLGRDEADSDEDGSDLWGRSFGRAGSLSSPGLMDTGYDNDDDGDEKGSPMEGRRFH